MNPESLQFLKDILATPSPSGYERPVQDIVRARARGYADEVTTDSHGNVIAVRRAKGVKNAQRIMLAGHCDQIALMVQHVDESGFLFIQPMGGWDMQVLIGQHLTVWGKTGPVHGVVSRKAIHLLTDEERKKVPLFTDIWVDIGAKDKADADAVARAGDVVTFNLGLRELKNGLVCGPAMDDKVGVWTVMEALRLLPPDLNVDVFAVSTVQEEIGLRGAITSTHGIDPTVGIAVDVCHASDTPGSDKKTIGEVKVGGGPGLFRGPNINPHVFDKLEAVATARDIKLQVRGAPRATGTDANAIQISRSGVAAGLVGIPNRYMHSPVEVVALSDLENAATLLAAFCGSLPPDTDWTP
ncbi:MAG: M42 family metallopeptidase [Gemmataceae bacterium]|nr:M42 family metallopeptidase [Gemmataceae bacterium]